MQRWIVVVAMVTVMACSLFVPFKDGVAMGVAILGKGSASRLPELRTVFETLSVLP